ncbi:MAG: hypothetical protein JNM42_12015 [Propionivibrio sp.]|nr:hypothetical protein [Propionivibrio sp.]
MLATMPVAHAGSSCPQVCWRTGIEKAERSITDGAKPVNASFMGMARKRDRSTGRSPMQGTEYISFFKTLAIVI